MLECEATGRNIEQAIENALLELRAIREDCDIKIIEQGGLFKKAKVYVKISDDAVAKYQKVRNFKEEETKVKQEIVEEPLEIVETLISEVKEKAVVEKPKKDTRPEAEIGKEFLKGLLESLNNNSEVLVEETETEIFYVIIGENASDLIGYRGDCLNAIQYLISIVNGKNNRHAKKVRLDIDGFKERRKNTLEALARRIAKKVEKTQHEVKLEPMTAYERRIIHTVIQEYPSLKSHSEGEEPRRYLVVSYKKEETQE